MIYEVQSKEMSRATGPPLCHMTMCLHTSSRNNSARLLLGARKRLSFESLYIGAYVGIHANENENDLKTTPWVSKLESLNHKP